MSQAPIERTIICIHCNQNLWTFKILSYFTAQHPDDAKIGATEWKSANPRVESREPGDSVDCPLCKKPFMRQHPKNKNARQLKTIEHGKVNRISYEWI